MWSELKWRILDFPEGHGVTTRKKGTQTYYFGHFPQNYMKLK